MNSYKPKPKARKTTTRRIVKHKNTTSNKSNSNKSITNMAKVLSRINLAAPSTTSGPSGTRRSARLVEKKEADAKGKPAGGAGKSSSNSNSGLSNLTRKQKTKYKKLVKSGINKESAKFIATMPN